MEATFYKRYFVKIRAGKQQALAETIYFRNDLPFEVVMKWKWFFEYRLALYKVSNPRHFTELAIGQYEHVPEKEALAKALKNKVAGKKRKITEFRNLLEKAENNWDGLFPIIDHPPYQKALCKIMNLEKELAELQNAINLT